jgi:hypothetical protein
MQIVAKNYPKHKVSIQVKVPEETPKSCEVCSCFVNASVVPEFEIWVCRHPLLKWNAYGNRFMADGRKPKQSNEKRSARCPMKKRSLK